MRLLLSSIIFCLIALPAFPYPAFISYSYSTCITCHYNGAGNGALTDYGKALYAQEIAARDLISSQTSDEELGERSGFFGAVETPYWFKPSIKYRGLWFQTNPGSISSVRKYIHMQRDFNLALFVDEEQKYGMIGGIGLLPTETDLYGKGVKTTTISREHYLRIRWGKSFYTYLGLLDKVFGIRTVDHTAFSRTRTGITQNAQTHGLVMHYIDPSFEVTVHGYAGNLSQLEADRLKGGTIMTEYLWRENHKPGFSLMTEKNDRLERNAIAIHDRLAISPKSSLLIEVGGVENKTSTTKNTGPYALLESMIYLRRGYNFLTTVERSQDDSESNSPEMWRWGGGFLIFPYPRFEVRAQALNYRTLLADAGAKDQWQLQGQLHLSW